MIISDNGSTDGSIAFIREHFPRARIVENGANLGFAKGNNAGIRVARGEYVLILNPDTIIHDRALEKLVAFADRHPEAGAFGCRVLNRDGSLQLAARPLPTIRGYLVAALYLRILARLSRWFESDWYVGWDARTERQIGFQSGCCVMLGRSLLDQLHGFDERFFYHFEEVDLCARVWKTGRPILFCPDAVITHLGGQSVGRFPVRFALETYRGRYRYFYKHFGKSGLKRIKWVSLLSLAIRCSGYTILRWFKPNETLDNRLKCDRTLLLWNWRLDPVRFVFDGVEPDVGYAPLAPPPVMTEQPKLCQG